MCIRDSRGGRAAAHRPAARRTQVSSPLLVVHWLCVFPSYIYALRLLLAKAGVLAADAEVLDLDSGDGVAFHLALLAAAASAATCGAALCRAVHGDYHAWAARALQAELS